MYNFGHIFAWGDIGVPPTDLEGDGRGVDILLVQPVAELLDPGGDLVEEHLLLAPVAFDDVHFTNEAGVGVFNRARETRKCWGGWGL